jgi:thioesterase domain-containing protein
LAFDGLDIPDSAGPVSVPDLLGALQRRGSALGDLTEQAVAAVLRVTENNVRLGIGFEPAAYAGEALLFQAAREGENDERARLWRPYVTGGITTHLIDATHSHMTAPQALSAIAPIVEAAILEHRMADLRLVP